MIHTRTIGDAIAIATTWITESELPFASAFIGGSVAYADPDSPYDAASDIDCYLVVDGDPPDGKIGKITVDGVLLDVSWMAWRQLLQAESNAVFASLLHFGKIVADTDGELTSLKQKIGSGFQSRSTINARLEDMRSRIRPLTTPVNQSQLPASEQVMNWLFPATLATHIPLVKACAPLTVRKRFLAAKQVMEPTEYEQLLALYGFDVISPERAQGWLDATATVFDATAELAVNSHRFWASDILSDAQPISIGGSQKLIDAGNHREALYWIIATSARCLTVRADAGVDSSGFLPAFEQMTNTLGITTAEQRAIRTTTIIKWIES